MAKYILFDTETTGAATEDRIIQIGGMIINTKTDIEAAVKRVREVMEGEDSAAIRSEADALGQSVQEVGAQMYADQPQEGGPEDMGGDPTSEQPPAADETGDEDEDVVDGEFSNAE